MIAINLYYENTVENSDIIYSSDTNSGLSFELGISWKTDEHLKWDLSVFFYYQKEYDVSINSGYLPSDKSGVGINTGIYFSLSNPEYLFLRMVNYSLPTH